MLRLLEQRNLETSSSSRPEPAPWEPQRRPGPSWPAAPVHAAAGPPSIIFPFPRRREPQWHFARGGTGPSVEVGWCSGGGSAQLNEVIPATSGPGGARAAAHSMSATLKSLRGPALWPWRTSAGTIPPSFLKSHRNKLFAIRIAAFQALRAGLIPTRPALAER
jgi:hypothetical protein